MAENDGDLIGIEEEERAVLEWVNSFDIPQKCNSLSELSDGKIICAMLANIDTRYFKIDDMGAVANSNVKKILKSLQTYYSDALGKDIDVSTVDVARITRTCDHDEMISLLELVIGCSVQCENKAYFIQSIFSLGHNAQTFLQGMVQRAMSRISPLPARKDCEQNEEDDMESRLAAGESSSGVEGRISTSVDDVQAREMAKFLMEERQRLTGALEAAEQKNAAFEAHIQNMQAKLTSFEQDKVSVEGTDRSRVTTAASMSLQLQAELEQAQRDLDIKTVENENLQESLQSALQRCDGLKLQQARLEIELQQITDELDLARDSAKRLAQAEASIEKYQRRLEELNSIKKQNKDLEQKMEEYLDKIHELESGNKSIAAINKKIEQYKNENIVLDREKMEALSALIGKEKQIESLQQELKVVGDAKKLLESELDRAKTELELATERETENDSERVLTGGLGSIQLLEKVKRLEIELRATKESSVSATTDGSTTGAIESSATSSSLDIQLLQQELEHTQKLKKERDDSLLAARKQIAELQAEVTTAKRELSEARETSEAEHTTASQAKELELQLSQRANTIQMLEEKLKEKESIINTLEQDKHKLENYSRQALTTFKDKYIQALQKLKTEKKQLEENVAYLKSKNDKDQETHRREERLVLSAVYEVGVRIMDRNIQSQVQTSSQSPTTFLGTQRADQDKNLAAATRG